MLDDLFNAQSSFGIDHEEASEEVLAVGGEEVGHAVLTAHDP
jgi:hypothetical protein